MRPIFSRSCLVPGLSFVLCLFVWAFWVRAHPSSSSRPWRSGVDATPFDGEASCPAVLTALIQSAPAVAWPPPCVVPPAMRAAFEGPAGSMPLASPWCFAQRYVRGSSSSKVYQRVLCRCQARNESWLLQAGRCSASP